MLGDRKAGRPGATLFDMGRVLVVSSLVALLAAVALTSAAAGHEQAKGSFAITSVRAMPGYHRLLAGRLNVVRVVPKLAFRVTIHNRDGVQQDVKLRLSVTRGTTQDPLVSEVALGAVVAHQARTVTVRLPSNVVAFAQRNWLRVQVASSSSSQTSARGYGVIFALG